MYGRSVVVGVTLRMKDETQVGNRLEGWVDRYAERLYRTAAFLSSPAEAEDLTQEVFLVAARRMAEFEGRSAPYTWLCGILHNLVRESRRRAARRAIPPPAAGWKAPTPEAHARAREDRERLKAALERLPAEQREVVEAYYLAERPVAEVAAELGCPVGTVKSRLYAARAALRRVLEGKGGGDDLP